MTLSEWCLLVGVKPTTPTTEYGAVSLIYQKDPKGFDLEIFWQLYHLEDYAVSTVSGPVVWLVPRKEYLPNENS